MPALSALPWWGFALLSALFAALTTILVKLGVEQVSSTLATAIRTVVVLAMAWLVLGETTDWRGALGIGLIVAGTLVLIR